jgi:CelD/BcsL family acetyltransferase involved in cellulose biosynthesis
VAFRSSARRDRAGAASSIGLADAKLYVASSLDELGTLEEVWDALALASGSVVQQLIWARACVEAYAPQREVRVVALGSRAIAPLARRWRGLESWELIGARDHYEPADFLYADAAHLDELVQALARAGCALYVERLRADSPLLPALRRAYHGRGLALSFPKPASPYLTLGSDLHEPEQLLSAQGRHDLRRRRRRAAELGPTRFELLSPSPAEVDATLDEVFRVEAAGWKSRAGTALAVDPREGTFTRRYASLAAERGMLRVRFMRIGDRAVATEIGMELADTYFSLKCGYDEAIARLSPGRMLAMETIRHAIRRGLRTFELMGNPAPYKQALGADTRPCVVVMAYPASASGAAALALDAAALGWKRVLRVVRGRW